MEAARGPQGEQPWPGMRLLIPAHLEGLRAPNLLPPCLLIPVGRGPPGLGQAPHHSERVPSHGRASAGWGPGRVGKGPGRVRRATRACPGGRGAPSPHRSERGPGRCCAVLGWRTCSELPVRGASRQAGRVAGSPRAPPCASSQREAGSSRGKSRTLSLVTVQALGLRRGSPASPAGGPGLGG